MEHVDILIVGGGAAGICAAKAAARGCSAALVDRRHTLGGVLPQCTHHGFGGGMTGPEYTALLLGDFPTEVALFLNTTVLSIEKTKTARLSGGRSLSFSQLILATGCREIPMGALPIAGTRPKGVFTAGQMQEMMNLHGVTPDGPVVILGSGDIGLIMAARIASLGIPVALVEQRETCGGLARNRGCLKEFPIRLLCSRTVTAVAGEKTLEGCFLSDGTYLPCRTLLIAVGLRPERTLSAGLDNPDWLQLCGNCNAVHPMIEGVIAEGTRAGILARSRLQMKKKPAAEAEISAG